MTTQYISITLIQNFAIKIKIAQQYRCIFPVRIREEENKMSYENIKKWENGTCEHLKHGMMLFELYRKWKNRTCVLRHMPRFQLER